MTEKKSKQLLVDLADPKDAEDKLSSAEAILEEKKEAVTVAQAEVREWDDKVRGLRILAGKVLRFDGSSSSPMQDLVVGIVEREAKQMRPVEVAEVLRGEGHQVASNDAVNAALLAAAEAGRLKKPQKRHYAPNE